MRRKSFFVFLLALEALLLVLGLWQWRRLDEKTELLAKIETSLQNPPIALGYSPSFGESYRPAVAEGEIDFARAVFWQAKMNPVYGGPRIMGSEVIAPMRLKDYILPVNLGWIADQDKETLLALGKATKSLTGIALPWPRLSYFLPKNDFGAKRLYRMDRADLAGLWQAEIAPFWLSSGADWQGRGREAFDVESIPNDHRQYAYTWFSLFFLGAVCGVIYFSRKQD